MTITVRLPEALDEKLRLRLETERKGLSDFVREAIAEKLDREGPERPSPYELGKNVFGRYGSGRDDLSTNRKAILDELLRAKHRR